MCSYHNHDVNVVYDFYAPLLSSTNKEGVLPGTKLESANRQKEPPKSATVEPDR